MSVEIKGLDSLRRKLQSLGGELEQATEKGVEKATKTVQTAAKLLCPVDTGYLRESIQTNFAWQPSGEYVGTVGTIVEYAPYVEFGTGQMGAASPSPPKAPLSWVIVRTGKASSHSRTSIPHWSITVTAS